VGRFGLQFEHGPAPQQSRLPASREAPWCGPYCGASIIISTVFWQDFELMLELHDPALVQLAPVFVLPSHWVSLRQIPLVWAPHLSLMPSPPELVTTPSSSIRARSASDRRARPNSSSSQSSSPAIFIPPSPAS